MTENNPVVAALPAGGWRAVYRQEDGSEESSPLIAWLVHQDGEVQPVDLDYSGYADNPKDAMNFVRLTHPDAPWS